MSDLVKKRKNFPVLITFSLILGVICGAIIWLFLFLMDGGIFFLWDFLPSTLNFQYYTLAVCIAGSLIIGIMHKKLGDYPEEMSVVFAKIKSQGSYDYTKVPIYALTAFVPLVLGASIGPEAGLVGLIAGLCSLVKNKFSLLKNQFADVAHVGFSAALAVVFQSPLFGFIEPLEDENLKIPKRSKTILYFAVILSAFGIFMLLEHYVPGTGQGIGRLTEYNADAREWILMIPCTIIGYLSGFIFLFFERYVKKAYQLLGNKTILRALIGGLILGLSGTFFPYTMFSGEAQIASISLEWKELGAVVLILTSILKLFVTTSCINSGFKGGHFFPAIFSGISLGYGFSIIFNIDPVFCCAAITSALMGSTLRKPVASALLLLLCFPLDSFVLLLVSALIGSLLPMPKSFIKNNLDSDSE